MSTLSEVLILAAVLLGLGLFATGFGRDAQTRLLGIPVALAGVGIAWIGVGRLAAVDGAAISSSQEAGVLVALVALALVIVGGGMLNRGPRR